MACGKVRRNTIGRSNMDASDPGRLANTLSRVFSCGACVGRLPSSEALPLQPGHRGTRNVLFINKLISLAQDLLLSSRCVFVHPYAPLGK